MTILFFRTEKSFIEKMPNPVPAIAGMPLKTSPITVKDSDVDGDVDLYSATAITILAKNPEQKKQTARITLHLISQRSLAII